MPRRTKKAPDRFPRPGKGLKTLPGGKVIQGNYIGIDEVGLGALAGPICFGAVAMEPNIIAGVRDSKLIKEDKRMVLADEIKRLATVWKIVLISPEYIDANGYDQAWDKGMSEVLGAIQAECDWPSIIDGDKLPSGGKPHITAFPKADQHVYQVAAASIVAKVYRDSIMIRAADKYPQYGFEQHRGYGTKKHIKALQMYGSCDIHRKSLSIVKDPQRKIMREELSFDVGKAQECIDSLEDLDKNNFASDWEKQFVGSIKGLVNAGKKLSPRQMFFLRAVSRRRGKK